MLSLFDTLAFPSSRSDGRHLVDNELGPFVSESLSAFQKKAEMLIPQM